MIIVISNWKKKVFRLLAVLMLIIAFTVAIPFVAGTLYQSIPTLSNWFDEEHPTGNPMRVEKENEGTKFDQMIDSFVFHLQEFYYEE